MGKAPFNDTQSLFIVTEEELQADGARVKEDEKVWREGVKQRMKPVPFFFTINIPFINPLCKMIC